MGKNGFAIFPGNLNQFGIWGRFIGHFDRKPAFMPNSLKPPCKTGRHVYAQEELHALACLSGRNFSSIARAEKESASNTSANSKNGNSFNNSSVVMPVAK